MGRLSSFHEHFLHVKTYVGLEQFELGKSRSSYDVPFRSCYEPDRTDASHLNCFKSAENRATSSPWVGGHRYKSVSCASKLLQVYSDLKLKNLDLFPGFPVIPRNHGTARSCSKSAENQAASIWVGGICYTGIKFASKLIWVQSDLKLTNLGLFPVFPGNLGKYGNPIHPGNPSSNLPSRQQDDARCN